MPAAIIPTSTPVIAGAVNNAGNAADGIAEAGEGRSFVAIFHQLAGKQQVIDVKIFDGATDAETEVDDALAALLPFLDAMGLTQVAPTDDKGKIKAEDLSVEQPADAVTLAGIASNQPVQAMTEAAISAEPGSDEMPNSQALSAQGKGIKQDLGAEDAATGNPRPEKAAGEYSAQQLVASIENGKEQPHLAGNTAATALQAVADRPSQNPHFSAALQVVTGSNVADRASQNPHVSAQTPPVTAAVGTAHWNDEVGNRVVWMANRMENRAELVLTPQQMGRIEVSLSISGDQASASFVSANPAVREALEAALPRLREVLADAGIQLGQAQVGAENARQSAQHEKNGDNPGFDRKPGTGMALHQTVGGTSPTLAGLKTGRGLVDVFA